LIGEGEGAGKGRMGDDRAVRGFTLDGGALLFVFLLTRFARALNQKMFESAVPDAALEAQERMERRRTKGAAVAGRQPLRAGEIFARLGREVECLGIAFRVTGFADGATAGLFDGPGDCLFQKPTSAQRVALLNHPDLGSSSVFWRTYLPALRHQGPPLGRLAPVAQPEVRRRWAGSRPPAQASPATWVALWVALRYQRPVTHPV